jgi:opacity protein-like surface antigen
MIPRDPYDLSEPEGATTHTRRRKEQQMTKTCKRAVVLGLALWMALPSLASAEWFRDLYLGAAWTRSHNASTTVPEAPVPEDGYEYIPEPPTPTSETERADFKSGLALGARVGYWFEKAPALGLALDVSYFQPDANGVDLTVVPVSALVMVRLNPKRKIQPYAGVGPGLFISHASVDIDTGAGAVHFSDTQRDLGVDARAGIAWQVAPKWGVFTEYRFTHFKVEFSDLGINAETILNTHYVLAGVRF